jgi:hypothetical protein
MNVKTVIKSYAYFVLNSCHFILQYSLNKKGGCMLYIKPSCKSFDETEVVNVIGTVQTGYSVQFSIQAIQFQVSENTQKPVNKIYSLKT